MDLSRSGLRILSSRRRRGIQRFVVVDRSGRRLRVRARVVWSKRVAFRKHVVGLELVGADENTTRQLARMGTAESFET